MVKQPHMVPGQLNIYVLDRDSEITSFGKHNRLIVSFDDLRREIAIREDHLGLPDSTEADRQRVACTTYQRMHPKNTRLEMHFIEVCDSRKATWYHYKVVDNLKQPRNRIDMSIGHPDDGCGNWMTTRQAKSPLEIRRACRAWAKVWKRVDFPVTAVFWRHPDSDQWHTVNV